MGNESSQRSDIAWLLKQTGGVRAMWFVAIASRVLNQLLMIAVLILAGYAILTATLTPWIWWIVGLSLLKAVLRYSEHYAGHWVAFTMLTRLRTRFYQALVPQAPAVVKGSAASELSERATRDIDRVEVFFAHTIPPVIAAAVVPVVTIVWSWINLGGARALTMTIASLVIVSLPFLSRAFTWPQVQKVGDTKAAVAIHLGDNLHGLREVLTFGAAERRLQQGSVLEDQATRPLRIIASLAGIRAALLLAVEFGTLALMVALPSNWSTEHAVLAALVWMGLWAPLRGVDDFADGLDDALESAERVRRTIDASPLVLDRGATDQGAADQGAADPNSTDPKAPLISVDDVTFAYPRQEAHGANALTNISADVREGQWAFMAGVSGSGKSALASLLARGWDPSEGQIRFRGINIEDLSLADLRSRIALVVQRPYLLKGTVAQNLRLSAPNASEEQLWRALWAVDMEGWARELPGQLDQEISTDGSNLSGGQIQRLAIARAVLTDPELLILDEATSQLDEATSLLVRQRIREAYPNLSVLEISHQVDRIPEDSSVFVIDNGRLVEQGVSGALVSQPDSALARLAAR